MNTLFTSGRLKTRTELATELGLSYRQLKRIESESDLDIPPYKMLLPIHQDALKKVILGL